MKLTQRTSYDIQDNYLENLMEDRGILPPIEERDRFFYPTFENEHDPLLLDHVEEGYQLLFKHLRQGSHIYLIVD